MKKRALAIVMAGLMAVSMSSVCAYAKDEEKEAKTEGFYIGLSNGYWGNTWRAQMVEDYGIDSIVSAKTVTADVILSYVRARKNSQGSANVETMYRLIDEKVEALEFIVKKETRYTNVPLKELQLKSNNLIACIARKRKIIIPNGDDSIQVGDNVIVITMERQIRDIEDILL